MREYFSELLATLNEMSPYLMLGFLISGLLHVYMPRSIYDRFLKRKGFGSVVGAAMLGVPLPLCSCGVIPTAMSLKKSGASDGATVSFLVSTPQTGVDSILATYSLLGLPMAIFRPVASFIVGVFSGVMVDGFGTPKVEKSTTPQFRYLGAEPAPKPESKPHACSCGCSHSNSTEQPRSIWQALKYGYVEMIQDFGKWLIVGLLVAAAITSFVPDSVFVVFKNYYFLNILLILLISTPMYICATGSTPVALSLILKGVSPGAAFVLLMAGPATNFASLLILRREIGLRKTAIYIASIVVGSIACALFIDFVMPHEWFSSLMPISGVGCGEHGDHSACSHGPIWWQTTTSVLFLVLFANAYIQKWRAKATKK